MLHECMQGTLMHTGVITGVINSCVSNNLPSNPFSEINYSWLCAVDVDPPTGCIVILQHL